MTDASYPKFYAKVLNNLKKAIKDSGISQRDQIFAGLDPRNVLKIKRRDYKTITLKTVWNLSQVFGFHPKKLFE